MNRRILLIDADPAFNSTVRQHVGRYAFDIVVEDNADKALALTPPAALIIIAVDEPDKLGFKVFQKAKKGATAKIPVMLVTGSVTPSSFAKHRELKTHADDYFDKRTMTPAELLAKVDTLVGLGDPVAPAAAPVVAPMELPLGDDGDLDIPVEVDEIALSDGDMVLEEVADDDDGGEPTRAPAAPVPVQAAAVENARVDDVIGDEEMDDAFAALLGDDMFGGPAPAPKPARPPTEQPREDATRVEAEHASDPRPPNVLRLGDLEAADDQHRRAPRETSGSGLIPIEISHSDIQLPPVEHEAEAAPVIIDDEGGFASAPDDVTRAGDHDPDLAAKLAELAANDHEAAAVPEPLPEPVHHESVPEPIPHGGGGGVSAVLADLGRDSSVPELIPDHRDPPEQPPMHDLHDAHEPAPLAPLDAPEPIEPIEEEPPRRAYESSPAIQLDADDFVEEMAIPDDASLDDGMEDVAAHDGQPVATVPVPVVHDEPVAEPPRYVGASSVANAAASSSRPGLPGVDPVRTKQPTMPPPGFDLGLDAVAQDAESEQSGVYDRRALRKIDELTRQINQLKIDLDRAQKEAASGAGARGAAGPAREREFLNLRETLIVRDKDLQRVKDDLAARERELGDLQTTHRSSQQGRTALEAKAFELEKRLQTEQGRSGMLEAREKTLAAQHAAAQAELEVKHAAATSAEAGRVQLERDLAAERARAAAGASEAERSLRVEREQLIARHQGEIGSLRGEAERLRDAAVAQLRSELEAQHQEAAAKAVAAAKAELATAHEQAKTTAAGEAAAELARIAGEHARELQALHDQHKTATEGARADHGLTVQQLKDANDAAVARLATELAEAKASHDAAAQAAAAAHASEIAAMSSTKGGELAGMRDAHAAELEAARTAHAGELAAGRAALEAAQRAAAAELEAARTAHVRELDSARAAATGDVEAAKAAHASELAAAAAAHANQLAAVQAAEAGARAAALAAAADAAREADAARAAADAARAAHARELEAAKAEAEAAASAHAAQLEAARQTADGAIAAHDSELAALRDAHVAATDLMRQAHASQLEAARGDLGASHAKAIADLEATHAQALASARASAMAALDRETAAATEAKQALADAQARYADAGAANNRALDEARTAHAAALAEARDAHAAELATTQAAATTAREIAVGALKAEMEELVAQGEQHKSELHVRQRAELEAQASAHAAAIAAIAGEKQRALDDNDRLVGEHRAITGKLKADHADAVADLEKARDREALEHRAALAGAKKLVEETANNAAADKAATEAAHAVAMSEQKAHHERALALANGEIVKTKAVADAEHKHAMATAKAEHEKAAREAEAAHDKALRETTGGLEKQLREATATHEKAERDTIAAHAKAIADATAEHERVAKELAGERDELRRGLSAARDDKKRADAELATAVQTLADRNTELRAHQAAIVERDTRIADLRKELEALEAENASYQEQVLRAYQKIKSDEAIVTRARKAMAIALTVLDDSKPDA